MIINRHNYEEIFLMYVDSELTPAQREEVEAFVQQNQDLADELKMLQQATLIPDEGIQFDDRHILYKREQGISLSNCEEYFLLDVDNELNSDKKAEVEKFVLQHPQLQEAFTLLHKTKLETEKIAFENKAVLYRKEERRVVPMRWMRMAAAAAVIGIVTLLYITMPGKNGSLPDNGNLANQPKSIQPKAFEKSNNVQPAEVKNKVEEQQVAEVKKQKAPAISPDVMVAKENAASKRQTSSSNKVNNSVAVTKPVTKPEQKINNLPAKANDKEVAVIIEKDNKQDHGLAPNINNRNPNSNTILETNNKTIEAATAKGDKDDIMKNALYREVDNKNEEEENSFLIGSAQINKNKLRGLLKKASGIFGKKGDKNEHQKSIQIASFEIKS